MSLANIESAYVAFNLPDNSVGRFLRLFYTQERPGVEYGHPEWEHFIVRREDMALISDFLSAAGYNEQSLLPETAYSTRSVFLDFQIPETERASFIKNLGCEMVSACEVCNKPLFGGAHKHILQFCGECGKKTKHATPFFGQPFRCTEH